MDSRNCPTSGVDTDSISFSNPTPVEGEEITISVEVKNIGDGTQTMNQDLVVDLYEGDPATQPLQILCKDVILELKSGQSKRVKTQWQPPPGKTEIYAVINPTGEKHIEETDTANNMTHATIVAEARTFLPVTSEQIQNAITKGITWIEAQQGRHSRTCLQCGTENQLILICITCGANLKGLAENFIPGKSWNFGEDQTQETALALQTLFATGAYNFTPTRPKRFSVSFGAELERIRCLPICRSYSSFSRNARCCLQRTRPICRQSVSQEAAPRQRQRVHRRPRRWRAGDTGIVPMAHT